MWNRSKWAVLLTRDILRLGIVNRSYAVSFALLGLLVLAATIVAAEVSAPFIYTLF